MLVHPKVKLLIEKSGADFSFYSEKKYPMPQHVFFSGGAYHTDKDTIQINDIDCRWNITECILHEFIHWTGSESRLCRPVVLELNARNFISYDELMREEFTAVLGSVFLAQEMGISTSNFYIAPKFLKNYDDLELPTQDAKRAVKYLINIINKGE